MGHYFMPHPYNADFDENNRILSCHFRQTMNDDLGFHSKIRVSSDSKYYTCSAVTENDREVFIVNHEGSLSIATYPFLPITMCEIFRSVLLKEIDYEQLTTILAQVADLPEETVLPVVDWKVRDGIKSDMKASFNNIEDKLNCKVDDLSVSTVLGKYFLISEFTVSRVMNDDRLEPISTTHFF
jgi:hypothetical protein